MQNSIYFILFFMIYNAPQRATARYTRSTIFLFLNNFGTRLYNFGRKRDRFVDSDVRRKNEMKQLSFALFFSISSAFVTASLVKPKKIIIKKKKNLLRPSIKYI